MPDMGIPGLSGRPRLPEHLLATTPTTLAATPLTPDKTHQLVDSLIQSLQRMERMLGITVTADQDEQGWTIRIDLPQ